MNELVGFLTILLFCLLKLNKHLKNKSTPKTKQEKVRETQDFLTKEESVLSLSVDNKWNWNDN